MYKSYGIEQSKKQDKIIKIMNDVIRQATDYFKIITVVQENELLPL